MASKMATAPPIPKIDNDVDLMLEIYTHASLRYPNAPLNDDYGDTARLADLGAKILEAVVSYHLFAFKPNKTATEIQEERRSILSPSNIGLWLDTYNLKSKLRANPSEIESILQSPEEMANFFHIYVGAIFIRKGLAPIQTWISALIDPGVDATLPGSQGPGGGPGFGQQQQGPPMNAYGMYGMHGGVGGMPQHAQHQQQQHAGYNPYGSPGGAAGGHNANAYSPYGSPPPPPGDAPPPPPGAPPPQPPPPPMGGPPPFAYGAANQLSLVSLALVNQTASQQGVSVTYPAEQTGPPHLPTWTVKCCMNGIERGRGVGKSMKVAKEEAARQAWAAMGWGPS